MAQSFSPKKYFSKIHTHALLKKLYVKHGTEVFFDINDQTPRKTAVDMLVESLKSLEPAVRIDVERDLSFVSSFSTKYLPKIGKLLYVKETGKAFEPEIECKTNEDYGLYFYMYHENMVENLIFLNEFYTSKTYIPYETKNINEESIDIEIGELCREFTRLVNKEDRKATECEITHLFLNKTLYLRATFEGDHEIIPKVSAESGTIDRKNITRRLETVRIAYIPQEKRVLIGGSTSKHDKLIFLDTFLRIICKDGYEGKTENYDLSPFKNLSLDFLSINKNTPLLRWKIASITIGYGNSNKKIKLSFGEGKEKTGMTPLAEALNELGMKQKFDTFNIENVALQFSFADKEMNGKNINISCSLSNKKTSLCPLFEYENYVRRLFYLTEIDKGFILEDKKDTKS